MVPRRVISMLLALAALGFGLYANSLEGSFQLDDDTSIVENRAVHVLDPAAWWSFWPGRIVAYGSFAANYAVHGLDVTGYHVVNVIVHVGAAIAVFFLVSQVLTLHGGHRRPELVALAAASIFISHPLQTQAVSYVVQRTAALCDGLYLGAVALYLLSLNRRREGRASGMATAGALALGLLACLTKEPAVTLPLAILLVDLVVGREIPGRLRRLAPFLALALVPLAIAVIGGQRFGVAGGALSAETETVGRVGYLLTQIEVVARYLSLVFVPLGQNVDHHIPWREGLLQGILPLLLLIHLLLFAAAAWLWRRGQRLWSLCILWFYVGLSAESSIFPIRDPMFEHRVYLSLFGPALAAALGLEFVAGRRPKTALVTLLIVVATLSTLTIARNRVWATPLSLWSDAVAKSPHKSRPRVALGMALGTAGRLEEARTELELAVTIQDDYKKAWNNLGNVASQLGDVAAGIRAYRRALDIDPQHVSSWYNLGAALDRSGQLDEAARAYGEALRLSPEYAHALNGLAAVRFRQGSLLEARGLAARAHALGQGAPRLMDAIDRALSRPGATP